MPIVTFFSNFFNQSTSAPDHPQLLRGNNQHNNDVHRDNFLWFEEDFDVGAGAMNPPRIIGHNSYRRYVQLSPLLPFGMMLIISTIIFILIIFRRWPGLVAGIVAGCLTSISIYLLLLTLKEQRVVYE